MSKPTDPPPPPESGTEAIAAASRPSPVQSAQNAYARHVGGCPKCRDVDRDRCSDGQQLWRAWEAACDDAYRQLAKQTP
jgi:hypothetical protein